ncbi:MAG: hypothetical protein ACK4E0_02790 [Chitinophagaceae bacterium]
MKAKWVVAVLMTISLALVTQARHKPEPLAKSMLNSSVKCGDVLAEDDELPAGNYPLPIFVGAVQ